MKRYTKKPMVLVAIMTLAVFLMGAAAVFTMKDLKIGDYNAPTQEVKELISLQGFSRSDSFKASKEWADFEESYDPGYQKLEEAEAAGYTAPEAYAAYPCYTQEMVDKVDSLCKKYDLEPLGKSWVETDSQKMFEMLGIPGITAPGAKTTLYSGYYFQGGTFHLEGDAGNYSFQYRCSMKNALDYVYLNVGNIEDYEQWNYALPDETVVLLAMSPDKALILADQDSYFASVNILNPQGMTKETLEALADSFDFSYQPQPVDPAKADARQKEEEAEFMAEQEALAAQYENWTQVGSYAQLVTNLKKDYEDLGILENAQYALEDMNGDGEPELILGENGYGWSAFTMANGKTLELDRLSSKLYLCDDGTIHVDGSYSNETEGEWIIHDYFRLHGAEVKLIQRVVYNAFDGQWEKYTSDNPMPDEIITEAEAMEIINSYNHVDLTWKPITEFPMN